MRRYKNLLLLAGVVMLVALPLWMVKKPETSQGGGSEVQIFRGTDDQAKELINKIAPGYQPWFKPLLEPASGEIGSLLFALQAALGAGFIGYYLGVANSRSKVEKGINKVAGC